MTDSPRDGGLNGGGYDPRDELWQQTAAQARGDQSDADDSWDDPDLGMLRNTKSAAPAFPLDVLPPAWRALVENAAEATGAPVDYVALGLLVSVAAICGCSIRVQGNATWREPLVLFGVVLGAPSSGKSPALACIMSMVRAIEETRMVENTDLAQKHGERVALARMALRAWEKDCDAAKKDSAPPPIRPACDPDEPLLLRQLVIGDATIESVADVLRANPNGVLLFRDELAALFSNMSRYNRGNDQPQWLEAWPAARLTVNRKNKPPVNVSHFAVSILGGIVPDRMAELLKGDDDGMVARFLYVWPDPVAHVPPSQRRKPDTDAALERLRWIEARGGTADLPLTITMQPEAVKLFDAFSVAHHAEALKLDGFEAGWHGKGPGHVLRLAGVLTLLDGSERPPPVLTVSASRMERAIRLLRDYFWPHARAALGTGGGTARTRLARRALRWLRENGAELVSSEDVRRHALAQQLAANDVAILIDHMVTGGWLRATPVQQTKGRYRRRWEVNPALFRQTM